MRCRTFSLKLAQVAAVVVVALLGGCGMVPPEVSHEPPARSTQRPAASVQAAPETGLIVWTVPSLERVGLADSPGESVNVEMMAARGEYESFQIIVQAPAGGLHGVDVDVSELSGPDGATIDTTQFTLYRTHYVEVVEPSFDPKTGNRPLGPGWYADALIPFVDPRTGNPVAGGSIPSVPVSIDEGRNQPFWVDLFVPREAAPGEYVGRYQVASDQGVVEGEIKLTVWPFELPLQPSLTTSFLSRERTRAMRSELFRHRLMPLSTPAEDQEMAIERWGLTAHHVGLYSGSQKGACDVKPPPPVDEVRALVDSAHPELMLYAYMADEIDSCVNSYEGIKAWARSLHEAGVLSLIPMTPVPELFDDGSGTGRSAVDIWVVLPKMYEAAPEHVAAAQRKGDQVWSYNALVQDDYSPKWLIDFAPINFRIQPGFINQSLGFTGLLYWSVDRWQDEPWVDVDTYINSNGWHFPGEGMLIYPGEQIGLDGVAPSMRLKWIRDGVEDYEYIALLKQQGQTELAMTIARSVGGDWHSWTRDPVALEQARRELAAALVSGDNPSD